jgi:hypothetical protein
MGAFELNRGLAEVPESVGEALGWQRCPEHADARSDNVAAPTTSVEVALERVLAAVTAAVAGRRSIAVPDRGIYVAFDEGVVATCVTCRVSWEVSRQNFKHLAWWQCPGGCRAQ